MRDAAIGSNHERNPHDTTGMSAINRIGILRRSRKDHPQWNIGKHRPMPNAVPAESSLCPNEVIIPLWLGLGRTTFVAPLSLIDIQRFSIAAELIIRLPIDYDSSVSTRQLVQPAFQVDAECWRIELRFISFRPTPRPAQSFGKPLLVVGDNQALHDLIDARFIIVLRSRHGIQQQQA